MGAMMEEIMEVMMVEEVIFSGNELVVEKGEVKGEVS